MFASQGKPPMKQLLAIGLAGLLAGCGTCYDWEVDHKTGQVYLAGTHPAFNADAAQEILQGAAKDLGRFAQGYAEGGAQYQPPPPSPYHSGAIFGPNGQTSLYNVGPNGGAIYGPNGQTTLIIGN
jgi:hypothetical protein